MCVSNGPKTGGSNHQMNNEEIHHELIHGQRNKDSIQCRKSHAERDLKRISYRLNPSAKSLHCPIQAPSLLALNLWASDLLFSMLSRLHGSFVITPTLPSREPCFVFSRMWRALHDT